jgi:hypothetical protein
MAMTPAAMVAAIKAARTAPTQTSDPAAAITDADAQLLALCTGIINHIVASSELVPLSTDSGSAGAGIITGKIK